MADPMQWPKISVAEPGRMVHELAGLAELTAAVRELTAAVRQVVVGPSAAIMQDVKHLILVAGKHADCTNEAFAHAEGTKALENLIHSTNCLISIATKLVSAMEAKT